MKTRIQLLISTIVLTGLIWAYADQASHDVYTTTVLVKYALPPEPGNPLVLRVQDARPDAPDLARAEMTVRGPKSAILRLEKDDAAGRFALTVLVKGKLKPGVQPGHSLFEDVSESTEMRNRGLTLQRVSPSAVTLEVDRYKNVTVPVEVDAGALEKSLVGKPIVQPEQIVARVLESAVEHVTSLPPLRVSIEEELQAKSESRESGSGTYTFDVPLRSSWPGVDATFKPQRVRVTANIARRTARERITLVPLGVLVEAQNFFGRYTITWQDDTGGQFTQAIDVRVPVQKAGQLKGNTIDAYVTIQDADLPKDLPGVAATEPAAESSWIEREIRFVFPAGFEDVKIEGPARTVKFRVVKKPDATASTALPLAPSAK